MRRQLAILTIAAATLTFDANVAFAQHAGMPPGMTHEEHLAQMRKDAELKRRGVEAMGFDQDKATHHFRLMPDGGAISISANSRDDVMTRDQIRVHLKGIADEFGRGTFAKPTATHAEVPPGVDTMQRLNDKIRYVYEETPAGGTVWIASTDTAAIDAVHAFLRYQITEHKTGDPLSVTATP
jgi:hypothetical protein